MFDLTNYDKDSVVASRAVLAEQQGVDADLARRDAFEHANALLKALGVKPWVA